MAQLVGGIAVSHSPQLAISSSGWLHHGDLEQSRLAALDLSPTTRKTADLQEELVPERLSERYAACQIALEETAEALRRMNPDVLLIVGDDQKELFLEDVMPMMTIFWGESIDDRPPGMAIYPSSMEEAYRYYHADEEEPYAVDAPLALHLVEHLAANDFDITQSSVQPRGRSLGHAFTFIYRRLYMTGTRPSLVPVFLNTYYPPNQPTPRRCVALGKELARGIRSMHGDARVAVVASGGLSHPIIDETLDNRVLDGLETRDWEDLGQIPMEVIREGTSEILNWIVAGATLEEFVGETVNYIPAYRSEAGSGCGMGFFAWEKARSASD